MTAAAKGNGIIVNVGPAGPRGRFIEGTISGTPKPGTCVQAKAGVAPVGNNFTYESYNKAQDGVRGPVIVLLEDSSQGRTRDHAYEDGTHCFLYIPVMGDELNLLVDSSMGAIDIDTPFCIDDGTGKLVAPVAPHADYATPGLDTEAEVIVAINLLKNAPQAIPFYSRAIVADPAADTHVRVLFGGC